MTYLLFIRTLYLGHPGFSGAYQEWGYPSSDGHLRCIFVRPQAGFLHMHIIIIIIIIIKELI